MYNCSKPHESTGTDENTTENNSDSDRSIVKTLTYSSSDSNDCKSNMFKSSKVNFDFIKFCLSFNKK